jgi:hypothetical protein
MLLLLLLLLLSSHITRAPGWTPLCLTGEGAAAHLVCWSGAAAASPTVTALCCGPRTRCVLAQGLCAIQIAASCGGAQFGVFD